MKISGFIKMIANHKKTILLGTLTVLSAVSIMSIGPTYAYLNMEGSSSAKNSFSVARSVAVTVNPDYSLTVGNTNYEVYVRAVAVVSWKKGNNVYSTPPVYSLNAGNGWTDGGDGFYYYSTPVKSGDSTTPLPIVVDSTQSPPETGYKLTVDILFQTIQAAGKSANNELPTKDAWNWSPAQS